MIVVLLATLRRRAAAALAAVVALALFACGLEVVGRGDADAADSGADVARTGDGGTDPPTDAGVEAGPTCLPSPSGLLGWWPGDDSLRSEAVAPRAAWTPNDGGFGDGVVERAFDLDGGAFLVVPRDDAGALALDRAVTLEGWVYVRTAGGRLIDRHRAGMNDGYMIDTYAGKLRLVIGSRRLSSEDDLPLTQWTHFAGTYDGTFLRIYVDGREVGELEVAADSPIPPGPAQLRLGGDSNGGSRLDGLLDEPAVYGRALAPPEIAAIVDAGARGRCKRAAAD